MLALLYCRTRETDQALRLIGDFDGRVLPRNAARFDGDFEFQVGGADVDLVFVTEAAMRVVPPLQEAGFNVRILADAPQPMPGLPNLKEHQDPTLPPGYRIEKRGTWHRPVSPDGRELKAGHKREAAENAAWADYMEMTGGSDD